ncbi:PAS domain S-box protein [Natronolimnobius baerhuensis]|uniref:PAS domain-containing protein n=1 Tax=Natronolimnobius baerhuensis TaxID=253108 RepID=A0A202E624_9EURY|nr:PAS domain S-box protein [Natronolimnobius baerhuensis]OVE83618.1 hypothetical protein B2G88_14395 [Natronolimnobius baerhuensis]
MHPSDSPDSSAETALAPETDAIARPTNRSVLLFTPDDSLPPSLESHLESESGLEVSNATSTGAVLQRLEATDCLVLVADETENAGETTTASVDVLDRLRNYAPAFPVVVVTTDPDSETATELATAAHTQRWTVHVPISAHDESADLERIGQRVTDLVDHHRLDGIVSRSLAAVELTEEPLAIVAPDGTFEHVTRRYTMQFGYSPSELEGQPWQTCFSDETVSHLESTAIATVTDGWRWTGHCTGREKSGEPVPVHIRLGGLEDGSLIFVATERDGDSEQSASTDAGSEPR